MTPAWENEDGSLDFNRQWHANVHLDLPGHLQLVTNNTIQAYITNRSEYAGSYPIQACSEEWFTPDATNGTGSGEKCLTAAVQLAPVCTVVEAGLVSLEHMLEKYNQAGKRLFRERAFVNLILVSDTHEPGATLLGSLELPIECAAMRKFIHD